MKHLYSWLVVQLLLLRSIKRHLLCWWSLCPYWWVLRRNILEGLAGLWILPQVH